MRRAPRKPIPVTVVAGQRGAGKTTLINRLLADPAFADTAVILNDFGEVALAGAPVERAEDGFIALGSGCVCCAVRGALTDSLENLLRDLDNGRLAAIGRVIIEADAAADPSAILAAIERHPYLALRYTADGVVAVVDATTARDLLATTADAVRQMAMADIVLLSRAAGDAVQAVRALNAFALVADAATVAPAAIAGHGPIDPATADLSSWLALPEADSASLSGEALRIRSFAAERKRSMPFAALDRFVQYLAMLQAPNLIRVRGAVATGDGETVIVDGIGGYFRPPLIADGGSEPGTRFLVIARDLEAATFAAYLDAFLGEARIDTPDDAALTDNPLAIAGFAPRKR